MQALWMSASSFLFATMGVCVKFASSYFTSAELVFYRGVLGMAFMAAYARARGTPLASRYPAMHAWRSVIGVVSLSAWFYAIAHLPLATAMTLNYMSSVWIAAFLVGAALMAWKPATTQTAENGRSAGPPQARPAPSGGRELREANERGGNSSAGPPQARPAPSGGRELREANERGGNSSAGPPQARPAPSGGSALHAVKSVGAIPSQGPRVLAILASFAGVVMLLRPAIDQDQTFAGLIGLLSGLGAAFAYMQVMAISRIGEPETRTVFYFAVGTTVAGGARHAGHGPVGVELAARGMAAAAGASCVAGADVHDPGLLDI